MNVLKLQKCVTPDLVDCPLANRVHVSFRRFPQLDQGDIFSLQDAFRKLDVDDRGYLDEATAIKATQQSERQPYDVVRQALKGVELDSSRRVELEDYIDVGGFVLVLSPSLIISKIWLLDAKNITASLATPLRAGSRCPGRSEPRGCDSKSWSWCRRGPRRSPPCLQGQRWWRSHSRPGLLGECYPHHQRG